MVYNHDEPIRRAKGEETDTDEDADLDVHGKVRGQISSKMEAPMEETPFKILIELKGWGSDEGRIGLDLVTVIDTSGSMEGKRLGRLKLAMQFLLQKLGRNDRLSVVTFHSRAKRLCPLRQITDDSRVEIEYLVNAIVAEGGTNIISGLELALEVLNGRTLTKQRRNAIMLMSDIDYYHLSHIPDFDVPIYTFGLGKGAAPELLSGIAAKSNGGMFSAVPDVDNLGIAFSQCLAGLLNVATDDLSLTMTPSHSVKVKAGIYPQSIDEDTGSVTVSFGSLYDKETRRVLVEFSLPAVSNQMGMNIITMTYKYRVGAKDSFNTDTLSVNITRRNGSTEPEDGKVIMEEKRLLTVMMMKNARELADNKNFEGAKEELIKARQTLLDEVDDMMKSELDQLNLSMESMKTYSEIGSSFAHSFEASHDRQRFAARGDVKKLRFFNIPAMDLYLNQALAFDQDPTVPVPSRDDERKAMSVDKDPMEEVDVKDQTDGLNRPFVPISRSFMYYTYMIIHFIKAIADRIKLWKPVVGNSEVSSA